MILPNPGAKCGWLQRRYSPTLSSVLSSAESITFRGLVSVRHRAGNSIAPAIMLSRLQALFSRAPGGTPG